MLWYEKPKPGGIAQGKEELETMENLTGALRDMDPEMKSMIKQMLLNPTLKHHLLLQFCSFMDENKVKSTAKAKIIKTG